MKNCTIRVGSLIDACRVCSICGEFVHDIDGACGRYLIDMKSILGIMSIGFGRAIDIYLHSDDQRKQNELREKLEEWLIKN